MLDIFVMHFNYHSRCLVKIDNEQSIVNMRVSPMSHVVSFYKYEKCKFEEAF